MTNMMLHLHTIGTGQCFPLRLYEELQQEDDLFAQKKNEGGSVSLDGITDEGLRHFLSAYPNETISKEDLF